MHISYDYSELIEELEGDITEGLINQEGSLLIVRSDKAIATENGPYYPIIDYYKEDFEQSIKAEIEEQKAAIDTGEVDWETLKEDRKLLRMFNKDKDSLVKMSVNEVLVEMYDYNRIIR